MDSIRSDVEERFGLQQSSDLIDRGADIELELNELKTKIHGPLRGTDWEGLNVSNWNRTINFVIANPPKTYYGSGPDIGAIENYVVIPASPTPGDTEPCDGNVDCTEITQYIFLYHQGSIGIEDLSEGIITYHSSPGSCS